MTEGRQVGFYYRPTPDGKRILLGGRHSSRSGDPDGLSSTSAGASWACSRAEKRSALAHMVRQCADAPRHASAHLEEDGVVCATGFCGSGVVWAPWVGSHAAYKLLGNRERARTAFDFRAGNHTELPPAGSHRPVARPPLTSRLGEVCHGPHMGHFRLERGERRHNPPPRPGDYGAVLGQER